MKKINKQRKIKNQENKNSENLGFFKNLSMFLSSKRYFATFSNYNNQKRLMWVIVFYLLYISISLLTNKYIFYYPNSPSIFYVMFLPIIIVLANILLGFLILKILKLKSKFSEFAIIYLMFFSLNMVLLSMFKSSFISVLVSMMLLVYMIVYIFSKNQKNIVKIIAFFVLFSALKEMEDTLERDKRHAEFGQMWERIIKFNRNTHKVVLEEGIEFCTNDWKENSFLDALQCYEEIYPHYYKYNSSNVESICLDPTNVHDTRRNENQRECLQFIAGQKIIDGDKDGARFCDNSKYKDEACLCKLNSLIRSYDVTKQEWIITHIKNFQDLYKCDNKVDLDSLLKVIDRKKNEN